MLTISLFIGLLSLDFVVTCYCKENYYISDNFRKTVYTLIFSVLIWHNQICYTQLWSMFKGSGFQSCIYVSLRYVFLSEGLHLTLAVKGKNIHILFTSIYFTYCTSVNIIFKNHDILIDNMSSTIVMITHFVISNFWATYILICRNTEGVHSQKKVGSSCFRIY